jgi:hypothetical protein
MLSWWFDVVETLKLSDITWPAEPQGKMLLV